MKSDLEDLKLNHIIQFIGSDVPAEYKGAYFVLLQKEPFKYKTGDSATEFSAVASGSSSGFQNIDVLEPDNSPLHLYWVTFGFQCGGKFALKIPTGADRLGIDEDKDVAYLRNTDSPWLAPNPEYGFWLIHDTFPAFNYTNDTPLSLTPAIYFEGYRFLIAKVADREVVAKLDAFRSGNQGLPFKSIMIGGVQ